MFFIAFLIVMSIIIVNLLVGLAVDDIKEVREAAALKKAALQVEMVLEVEKILPDMILSRFSKQMETLTDSIRGRWLPEGIINKRPILRDVVGRDMERVNQSQGRQADLLETIGRMRRDIDDLTEDTAVMKKILIALAQKQDIELSE